MKRCDCGSYAINIEIEELGDANCDVCHYKNKATQVAAEAYQVIGALSSDLFHSKEVIRALDYFSAISCGENPSEEMLPFLCDWEQDPERGQLEDRLWDKFQSLLKDDDPVKQQSANAKQENIDAIRYARLRILGAAPYGTAQLEKGTVLRFQSLDALVDADINLYANRGESFAVDDHSQSAAAIGSDDLVLIPRGLIGAACSAIDKKREGGNLLLELRRYTTGDLSKQPPSGAVSDIYKRVIFEQPDEEKQLVIGVDDSDCPYFILGVQKFRLDPTVIENREHAKWYQKQLAIAFEKFTEGTSINQSPHITEHDAREIALNVLNYACMTPIWSADDWFNNYDGRDLLNKLNTKNGGVNE